MGSVVPLRFGIDGRFVRREFFELLRIGESGADQIDVEAAFDVPHGDAESRAEIGGGADGFGAGVFVEEGSVKERVEAMGEVAGGVGGVGQGDEVVEGEEGGIFCVGGGSVGQGLGFEVDDGGVLGVGGDREEEEEKRKDNAEERRALRCAEKSLDGHGVPCPCDFVCGGGVQRFLRRVGLGDFDFGFCLDVAAELAAAIFLRTRGGRILFVTL